MSLSEKSNAEIEAIFEKEAEKSIETLARELMAIQQEKDELYAGKDDQQFDEKIDAWDADTSEEAITEDMRLSLESSPAELEKLHALSDKELIIRMAICHKTPISELDDRRKQIDKSLDELPLEKKLPEISSQSDVDEASKILGNNTLLRNKKWKLDEELQGIRLYQLTSVGQKRRKVENPSGLDSIIGTSIGMPYKIAFFILLGIIIYQAYFK